MRLFYHGMQRILARSPKWLRFVWLPAALPVGFLIGNAAWAADDQAVDVMAELSPPFILEDGSGYTARLLQRVSALTGLDFRLQVFPSFERAWRNVAGGRGRMVVHIALDHETNRFREAMLQSEWYLPVQPAVFFKGGDKYVRFIAAVGGPRDASLIVGLPHGNMHYGVRHLGLPDTSFHEAPH